MDVDARMDRAVKAAERQFSRSVTLTPASTGIPLDPFDADFREAQQGQPTAGDADYSTVVPRLDCRAATLEDAGVSPAEGDAVAFSVRGVARAYKITGIERPAPETLQLLLGRRTA